jgi:hypothetical protein
MQTVQRQRCVFLIPISRLVPLLEFNQCSIELINLRASVLRIGARVLKQFVRIYASR